MVKLRLPVIRYCPIPNYPDHRAGTDGSVWSKKRGKWKRLATSKAKDRGGYTLVTLCHNGVPKTFRLAGLILTAFVGPRPPGMLARHFPDPDVTNNRLSNLRWGTNEDNQNDRKAQGTYNIRARGEELPQSVLTWEKVDNIRKWHAEGRYTRNELAAMHGVMPQTISRITTGKGWKRCP